MVMCTLYSFCAFFHIFKRVYSEWIGEPHDFLITNDLAPCPPPPPISKLDQRDIGRLIKGLVLQIEKYLKRRSAANG